VSKQFEEETTASSHVSCEALESRKRTQVDSCNATTTSTHNSLQQNTFLVTKIAFQTERSGILWILQFCKPLKTTSVAVAATTFFLITPAQTHVELHWVSLEEEFIKRKKMDKWTDGQSSPS
jgi:hypothetical protein